MCSWRTTFSSLPAEHDPVPDWHNDGVMRDGGTPINPYSTANGPKIDPTQPGGIAQVRGLPGCGLIPLLALLAVLMGLVGVVGLVAPGVWDHATRILSSERDQTREDSATDQAIEVEVVDPARDASVVRPTGGLSDQQADLVEACDAGEMEQCDRLREVSEWGTPAYDFGRGCGGWYPADEGFCLSRQESAAELQELITLCQGDDMSACDSASWRADEGSEEWKIAQDCAGRFPGKGGSCSLEEIRAKYDSPTS